MFCQLSFLFLLATTCTCRAESDDTTSTVVGKYDFLEPRIVHGHDAKEGEIPYQLSIIKQGYDVCGASLVVDKLTDLQFAITAAHCLTGEKSSKLDGKPGDYQIRGGSIKRNGGQTLTGVLASVHRNYDYETRINDIALLFFDDRFKLSSRFHAIDLPDNQKRNKFETVHVSGWGRLSTTDPYSRPRILQTVSLPVVENDLCKRIYNQVFHLTVSDTQFCAGYTKEGSGAFRGDSGGPAVVTDEHGSFLAGVVSFGPGGSLKDGPGVYTRVLSFVKWTNMIVGYVNSLLLNQPIPRQHTIGTGSNYTTYYTTGEDGNSTQEIAASLYV